MSTTNRMGVAVLALIGVFISAYLTLYSFGMIGSLACGPGGSCSFVQSTRFAYFLGIPVAVLGLVGYLAIFIVAMIGTRPATVESRWISVTLLVLTTGGFVFSMYLTALEAWVIHAWCRWCVASAILATLAFLLTLPEIRRLKEPPLPHG